MSRSSDSPLPAAIRGAVRDYQRRVEQRFGARLRLVRVFGSWARDEAHEASDIDVAVVIEQLSRDDWREAVALVVESEARTGVTLSPLVLSEARLRQLVARERQIARAILEEGKVA